MHVNYSKKFKKLYKKSDDQIQQAFDSKILLFLDNQNNPILNVHRLHGKYSGFYSLNVTGDIRAVFHKIDFGKIKFVAIGSHSELYS